MKLKRYILMAMPLDKLKTLLDEYYAKYGLNVDTLTIQRVYSYRLPMRSK